jgi:uncharacterized lipoprotein YmbA
MTRKPTLFVVPVLLYGTLVSCSAPPVRQYYTLVNDALSVSRASAPLCALPLVITSVTVAPSYANDDIVFRSDVFQIHYDNYCYWASPPDEMLTELLRLRLVRSGLFSEVEQQFPYSEHHLMLHVLLNAMEETDQGDGWYARLAMSFVLRTADDQAVLWRRSFDAERPVKHHDVLDVVRTLSAIYNQQTDRTLASLADFVASYPECRKPPAPATAKRQRSTP